MKLALTQQQYTELVEQISKRAITRFYLDGSGEFHYPHMLDLSDDLEARILRACGELGPGRFLALDTVEWDIGPQLEAYAFDKGTNVFSHTVDIEILEEEEQ